MEKFPPVSVYIVTYLNSAERGEVLRKTCQHALALNYPDFEVVISDNGGSYAAADALASIDDERVKVVTNESNAGFTGNMNRCVKHCSHDIIKPLCDDDLVHPDFLKVTVPLVDDKTLVIVEIEKFPFNTDPEGLVRKVPDAPEINRRSAGYGGDLWVYPFAASSIPSATVFTRKLFDNVGGFDAASVTSDWDFFIETALRHSVVYVGIPLCFVGIWEGSLTETMLARPYFFPCEGLYTRIRILRCKALSLGQRMDLHRRLLIDFIWQGLRVIRHPFTWSYHIGYAAYISRSFKWAFIRRSAFMR